MKLKDLKVGDKVYIRDDLKDGFLYGDSCFVDEMDKGLLEVSYVSIEGTFIQTLGNSLYEYTHEMIDWEKTKDLKADKSWENVKRAIRGGSTFKEITQSGENGNEVTKAICYDLREISVKNNGEENDIEKAVMLIMLKSLGVTYSDIKEEVKKVKFKWTPAIGEQFYYISTTPTLKARALTYFTEGALKEMTDVGNCFRTKEDAEEKLEKIKEVLKGE